MFRYASLYEYVPYCALAHRFLCAVQGDLGSIEPKYDVAVSTAIRRLDNLVVETVDQAVKAIELLKQHDVGRATFVCMDKMERWKEQMHRLNQTYVLLVY